MHNSASEIVDNFEEAMARMASDPAIIAECRSIAQEFAATDMDGLNDW
jgi:hypothetical protein